MQTRLLNPKPQQIESLSGHARFRAGFDFLLLRENSGDDSTQGMGAWWDAYQTMSADEKEKAIAQYNRKRSRSRRKAAQDEAPDSRTSEIEPLVQETESRGRRQRKPKTSTERPVRSDVRVNEDGSIGADHPIMKRKRVQRDLSQVVFGPTQ